MIRIIIGINSSRITCTITPTTSNIGRDTSSGGGAITININANILVLATASNTIILGSTSNITRRSRRNRRSRSRRSRRINSLSHDRRSLAVATRRTARSHDGNNNCAG